MFTSVSAETFWSSRPVLMSVPEVAPLLRRTEATVASLAARHEIGAYKVAGRWLIARIDLRGFAASDGRAAKSDLGLLSTEVAKDSICLSRTT